MSALKPHMQRRCSKPMPGDEESDGRGYRVYCEEDDPGEADRCVLKAGQNEFEFERSKFDASRWDSGLDRLEWALQWAYDEGRSAQQTILREALGIRSGLNGDLHGPGRR